MLEEVSAAESFRLEVGPTIAKDVGAAFDLKALPAVAIVSDKTVAVRTHGSTLQSPTGTSSGSARSIGSLPAAKVSYSQPLRTDGRTRLNL